MLSVRCGSLFSGIGLLDYGLTLAGLEHAWLCEADPWRREILRARWPGVPVYDDVRAVDSSAARVDLLAGGFPCRGASTAGDRSGMDHPETALWREMARIADELRPRYLLLENVANLLAVRGGSAWGEVLGDLASLGYVVAWDCLPAAAFGAPHLRDRVFCVAAHADQEGWDGGWPAAGQGLAGTGRRQDAHGRSAPDADWGEPQLASADARPAPDTPGTCRVQSADEADPGDGGGRGGHGSGGGGAPDWGSYAGAVHRWEEVAGPAPEPLVRGVDARSPRRVVRSRLSALGDGVQVQAGEFIGRRLMALFAAQIQTPESQAA